MRIDIRAFSGEKSNFDDLVRAKSLAAVAQSLVVAAQRYVVAAKSLAVVVKRDDDEAKRDGDDSQSDDDEAKRVVVVAKRGRLGGRIIVFAFVAVFFRFTRKSASQNRKEIVQIFASAVFLGVYVNLERIHNQIAAYQLARVADGFGKF